MISIEVKDLTKTYRIYQAPSHRLKEIILRKPLHTVFHALQDLSFSVYQGENMGIVGENGAGKSTLLKILAKTLKPTSGSVTANGRTAALLELGAGFNPELTGEENIYLNAYLLGLSKDEINGKKQEIIDFSELENFIKQPVKTYSSGMSMRLAFSIATCVDPDILIVDEALSVGDQSFQKKCIDRMMEFKKKGKTILFCSHSLYLVQELCSKAVWLHRGKIAVMGKTSKVINAYNDWSREKDAGLRADPAKSAREQTETQKERKPLWLEHLKITDNEGRELDMARTGQDICLRMVVRVEQHSSPCSGHVGIGLNRNDEEAVSGVTTKIDEYDPVEFFDGQEICLRFPSLSLLSGQYYFIAVLIDNHALHPYDVKRSKMLYVEDFRGQFGIVNLDHAWEISAKPLSGCDKL